jgi:hypothetical protein
MVNSKFTNQIHISSDITEKIRTIYFKFILLIGVLGLISLYNYFGLTIELIILTFTSILLYLFFKYLYNDFVDLSLKGEYIIIKKADKKNFLVPINNVNKCKSTRFFNLIVTQFEFNLDGIKRKVYFVATNEKISTFHSHRNKEMLHVA